MRLASKLARSAGSSPRAGSLVDALRLSRGHLLGDVARLGHSVYDHLVLASHGFVEHYAGPLFGGCVRPPGGAKYEQSPRYPCGSVSALQRSATAAASGADSRGYALSRLRPGSPPLDCLGSHARHPAPALPRPPVPGPRAADRSACYADEAVYGQGRLDLDTVVSIAACPTAARACPCRRPPWC